MILHLKLLMFSFATSKFENVNCNCIWNKAVQKLLVVKVIPYSLKMLHTELFIAVSRGSLRFEIDMPFLSISYYPSIAQLLLWRDGYHWITNKYSIYQAMRSQYEE
jgi:hypothetical protein